MTELFVTRKLFQFFLYRLKGGFRIVFIFNRRFHRAKAGVRAVAYGRNKRAEADEAWNINKRAEADEAWEISQYIYSTP